MAFGEAALQIQIRGQETGSTNVGEAHEFASDRDVKPKRSTPTVLKARATHKRGDPKYRLLRCGFCLSPSFALLRTESCVRAPPKRYVNPIARKWVICQWQSKIAQFWQLKIVQFERGVAAPRRGVGDVGLDGAMGKRVAAATAKSLAAATRLSIACGRHRFGWRSQRGPLAASIQACLQQGLMIPHPVGVPADVDDVAVVHQPVDESRCHDFVAEHAAPVLEALV